MKKFKRLIAIVTVLLFALTLVAPAFAQDESTTNPVYEEAAKVLKEKGVMQGNESGDLMLDKTLTRAEVVTMILRATGQEDVAEEYADAEASFSDTANHWAKKYIEAAKELGIVNGYPDGTFKPEAPIKFEELCKLLVAAANETPAAGKWPLNYVKKAMDLGYFNGIEDEVGIGQLVVRGQAAVGFQTAFFPVVKPAPIVKNVEAVDNTTITVTVEAYPGTTLEDGDVSALDFEIKDAADETKLLGITDATLDVATGKVTIKTASQEAGKTYKVFFKGQDTTKTFAGVKIPLTVDKVEALNYKEIKVTFNKEVEDATAASTKSNYTIKKGTATVLASNAILSSDKKSVLLLVSDSFTNNDTVVVTVSKNVGISADYTATISNFLDTTAPTVESVTGVGLTKVIVKFSEAVKADKNNPIYADSAANYLLDNAYIPARVDFDYDTYRTATLTFYSPLAEGSHTIQFTNIKDFAGYGLVTPVMTFKLAADTTAVTAPTVVSASQTQVKLKFNKGIMQVTSVSASPSGSYANYSVDVSDPTLVTLNFGSTQTTALPASGAVLTLSVIDVAGISTTGLTVTVTPTVDVTRPTFVNYSVDSQNQIKVTFSEDVNLDGSYKLTESDGDIIYGTPSYYQDAYGTIYYNQVVLTFARNIDSGSCSLVISGVTDKSPLSNKIVDTTVAVSMADKTAPTVAVVAYDNASAISELYITFSEVVTAATALNPTNYTLIYTDGTTKTLASISTAYLQLLNNGKTVYVKLGSTQSNVSGIVVSNIADAAGNTTAQYFTALSQKVTGNPTITNAKLIANNKIELTVSGGGVLKYISPADFIVYYNSADNAATTDDTNVAYITNASYDSSSNKITLTLNTAVETSAKYKVSDTVLKDVYVKLPSQAATVDIYGMPLTNSYTSAIVDGCSPTATVETADGSSVTVTAGTYNSQIKITFSEIVNINASDYGTKIKIVDGIQTGDNANNPNYVKVETVNGKTVVTIVGLTSGKTYKVRLDPSIVDSASNSLGYVSDFTVAAK